jgi:HEAT repeat protein
MAAWLRRLLSVRVGESRRTTLLYVLYFLLVLGSVWGETASEGLFIEQIGLDAYSIRFIAEAAFTLVFTLLYTAFVDRISNTSLLLIICLLTGVSLLVTGFLLIPGLPIAFYLFYLIGRTTRVLFTVHVWTYISDFYDTRAARRLFPLIGSAGRISGFLGGLALPLVVRFIHAENMPYVWIGLLVVSMWLIIRMPRWTKDEVTLPEVQGRTTGVIDNFRGGWQATRESQLLRLLVIGTTTMTALLVLLNFQFDYVFSQNYQSADDLTGLFGLLKGLANALALPFQLFLLTRIVNQVGVGWSNLIYPLLCAASFGTLGFFPFFGLAVLGLFTNTAFRWGIRNPVDNMLYNAVPRVVKGRARAFVNAVLVPVATFLAGTALIFVPSGEPLPWYLFALGSLVGLVYLFTAWRVRSAYSEALVRTLAAEDKDLYELAGASWDAADRAALDSVISRLRESRDEGTAIFLAQLAYEVGGGDALQALGEIAEERGPNVRAAILEIVGAAGLADPQVRQLCTDGLADPEPAVRRAALAVLEEQSGPEDLPLLALALDHLQDTDPTVRTRAISLLLRSGDFYYLTAAAGALNEMLTGDDPALRALAISALGEMGDSRFVRTLVPHLEDQVETVRRAAATATAAIVSSSAPQWVRELMLEAARKTLADSAESVRLASIQILAKLDPTDTRPLLLDALGDSSVRVRENARQLFESMGAGALQDLEAILAAESGHAREAAIVALLHLSAEQYRSWADTEIDSTIERVYSNLVLQSGLAGLDFSGTKLVLHTLYDRNTALLDHVFRILAALHGEEAIDIIHSNLTSDDTRLRANAIEALEAYTSPTMTRLITPLSAPDSEREELLSLAQEELNLQPVEPSEVIETLLTGDDAWLKAVAVYLIGEAGKPTLSLLDAPKLISRARREEVIAEALESSDALIAEAARRVARQPEPRRGGEEVSTMLSTIEKVIFLKEVSIFDEMTVAQLRSLAGIAEEVHFEDDELIFEEGAPGDSLYVVVSGRVGIERKSEKGTESVARLATLESRQYFGEMSIFDRQSRAASAIAVGQTLLLSIRREPLIALVEGDPTIALELIRVRISDIRCRTDSGSRCRCRLENISARLSTS